MTREPGVYPTFPDTLKDWAAHEDEIDWEVVPFSMGPVWKLADENWDGPVDPNGYILPKLTLGWQAIKWGSENLLADETDENDEKKPFKLTAEQARFVLWFYEIDETGRLINSEYTLQRLKGHGKDPLAVYIAAVEFVGPCRFAGWAARDMPEIGVAKGDPVGKGHPRAWVQIAATALSQTQNSMSLFRGLFTDACIAEHGIDIGKEVIYAYGGARQIQAVTSSPRVLEGNRPTLTIVNEPHQWVQSNKGLAMYDAMERNAAKAKGGASRVFAITNAYNPSEESVGKMIREAYEMQQSGVSMMSGVVYDSLEAPKNARLRPLFPDEQQGAVDMGIPEIPRDVKVRLTKKYLRRILEAVRGDSIWLDIERLTASILDPKNSPSRSRRFWFNAIVASEDAWVHPDAVQAAIHPEVRKLRSMTHDPLLLLEAGWEIVKPTDQIVMFFDGSKTDDSTALVGCRVSDGYTFLIGVWAKPEIKKGRSDEWRAPRGEVDRRVEDAFSRFNIVAFWGDPSHAKSDEGGEFESSFWMPYLDKWMQEYGDHLNPAFHPVKTGIRRHAINFDMSVSTNPKAFIEAAEQTVDDFENLNDIEDFDPTFKIDGHPVMVQHLNNAIRYPDQRGWGTSLAKESKDSPRKIDVAVCVVGARMLRRVVLNNDRAEEAPKGKRPGIVW